MNLKAHKEIQSYKISDNKTVYYSTRNKPDNDNNIDSKLWGKLFDLSYQGMESLPDALSSTAVWKNSYDGSNISKEEMSEWLDNTLARIKKLISKDCNVLEIGCGNGLIFNSIIDNINKYTGTDVAEKGLNLIAKSKKGKLNVRKIELYQVDALNIDKIPNGKFDLIIINSVAQYFSSLDYLLNFIKKLEQYASSNCHIFLGDIRSYQLQKLFYFNIIKNRYPEINDSDVQDKINKLEIKEKETFYHTHLFKHLPSIFDYINSSCIELKDGRYDNELNIYRYDVTLLCNSNIEITPSIISIKWDSLKSPEIEIRNQLNSIKNDSVVEITDVPNIRFLNIEDKYKALFKKDEGTLKTKPQIQTNTIVPTISFFTELVKEENIFVQINFAEEDFFKFTVQFCKSQSFNLPDSNRNIEFEKLSNRLNEKKTQKDQELEENIRKEFPNIECIKVSKFLLP